MALGLFYNGRNFQMLETVAYSTDMLSHLGRSLFIYLSASTPAPVFAPR